MAALQQQLTAAVFEQFINLLLVFLNARYIRLLVPGPSVKVAKLTVGNANIRGVGIAVDDPSNFIVGHMLLPQAVGNVHQFSGGSLFKKKNALLNGQVLQVQCPLQQLVDTHSEGFLLTNKYTSGWFGLQMSASKKALSKAGYGQAAVKACVSENKALYLHCKPNHSKEGTPKRSLFLLPYALKAWQRSGT